MFVTLAEKFDKEIAVCAYYIWEREGKPDRSRTRPLAGSGAPARGLRVA